MESDSIKNVVLAEKDAEKITKEAKEEVISIRRQTNETKEKLRQESQKKFQTQRKEMLENAKQESKPKVKEILAKANQDAENIKIRAAKERDEAIQKVIEKVVM